MARYKIEMLAYCGGQKSCNFDLSRSLYFNLFPLVKKRVPARPLADGREVYGLKATREKAKLSKSDIEVTQLSSNTVLKRKPVTSFSS